MTVDDTIVSFNYDRVVELATRGRVRVPVPNQPGPNTQVPHLYKLHGSVDWVCRKRDDGRLVVERDRHWRKELLAPEKGCAIGIAVPGRSEYGMRSTVFSELWDAAARALTEPEEVIIVGYSQPPSDSTARTLLLEHLRRNSKSPTVKIVLGADKNTPDTVRLRHMLRSVTGGGRSPQTTYHGRVPPGTNDPPEWVEVLPLFAQDVLMLHELYPR